MILGCFLFHNVNAYEYYYDHRQVFYECEDCGNRFTLWKQ